MLTELSNNLTNNKIYNTYNLDLPLNMILTQSLVIPVVFTITSNRSLRVGSLPSNTSLGSET